MFDKLKDKRWFVWLISFIFLIGAFLTIGMFPTRTTSFGDTVGVIQAWLMIIMFILVFFHFMKDSRAKYIICFIFFSAGVLSVITGFLYIFTAEHPFGAIVRLLFLAVASLSSFHFVGMKGGPWNAVPYELKTLNSNFSDMKASGQNTPAKIYEKILSTSKSTRIIFGAVILALIIVFGIIGAGSGSGNGNNGRIPGSVISAVKADFSSHIGSDVGTFVKVNNASKGQTDPVSQKEFWVGTYTYKLTNGQTQTVRFGVWVR